MNKRKTYAQIECSKDGLLLQNYKYQSKRLCLIAVSQNGAALQYVINQTEQICLVAVRQNPSAIIYVKNITKSIAKSATKWLISSLQYIPNQKIFDETEYCNLLKRDGSGIKYIKNPTPKMIYTALKSQATMIDYIYDTYPKLFEDTTSTVYIQIFNILVQQNYYIKIIKYYENNETIIMQFLKGQQQ